MKRVLVTGGNGFIGNEIIDCLLGNNIEVVSFDLLPPKSKKDGVKYITGTVLDEFLMARELKQCDGLIHLAAVIGVKKASVEKLSCLNVNILGSQKVLQAACMAGIEHVLVASSSEVFGDSGKKPYSETSSFNPKSAYAVSKLATEQFALAYAMEFGISHKVVRYFNVYGPNQSPNFVMSLYAKAVIEGTPLLVYGDGNQIRAFCSVKDAARATVDLFLNENLKGETFNIGNDSEPITIKDLAHKFSDYSKGKSPVQFVAFEKTDRTAKREIYCRTPDITKARKLLQYEPQVSLDEGIVHLIENMKE